MEEIFKRRSIRKYTNQEISNEILSKILKAGMNAPTARNQKPFEFIVVKDKNLLSSLAKTKPSSSFIENSNIAIIVLGKKLNDFLEQDLSAVTQNILLEATHFNIGSCWIGITPNKDYEKYIRDLLNIPDDIIVFNMISLGYSDESKENNDYYDEFRIHYDKY